MQNWTLHYRGLGRVSLAAAMLAIATPARPAGAQEIDYTQHTPSRANGSGLECRQTTHPTFAFASPSPSAAPVARIISVMAVSGPAVGDWVPVELDGRRKAWVLASDTVRNTHAKSCFVRRAKDGHLIYSTNNRIS